MAFTIEELTELIPVFYGDLIELPTYIENMDIMWNTLGNNEGYKKRFVLVTRLKLKGKAAEALRQEEILRTWPSIKEALKETLIPKVSINTLKIQLQNITQSRQETIEEYGKRVSSALKDLNSAYEMLEDVATRKILVDENNKKARIIFEDGLINIRVQDRVMNACKNNLKEAIAYAIEQESRISEAEKRQAIAKNCDFFDTIGHEKIECRRKN